MKRTFPKFGYNPVTGEWNDSLTGEFLWSSVNVSEAVPDVMTPSTWSLWWIFHYEESPFEFPGDFPFCGNICGRPYLNLSLLASVYRAVGEDVCARVDSAFHDGICHRHRHRRTVKSQLHRRARIWHPCCAGNWQRYAPN